MTIVYNIFSSVPVFEMIPIILFSILSSALAQDANCDFTQNVQVGRTYYVYTPNYPRNYTPGIQCRWIATCPSGYNCKISSADVAIPSSPSCSMDRLLISKSGDPQLSSADTYCGRGSVSAVSTAQRISIGLITSSYSTGGRFMFELTAQVASPPSTCWCGERKQNRIVGGQETRVNEFRMMAGLVDRRIKEIKCGGVLLSDRHVLTAAHCLEKQRAKDLMVLLGEHDVTTGADTPGTKGYKVESLKIHPQYSSSNYDYDIAIVTTEQNIQFNDYVGPVCLPFKFLGTNTTGFNVTMLGWGTLFPGGPTSNTLQKVDVEVISSSACRAKVPSVTDRQLCTFTPGKDACQDDSGGPLLYTDPSNGLLYSLGIISYGKFCASNDPGINTKITAFLNWIVATTRYDFCKK